MKVLIYTVPYMMNATYYIDIGYANAFRVLGHDVHLLQYGNPLPDERIFVPDISISCFHIAYSEKTDYAMLAKYKERFGTRIVVWGLPFDVPAQRYTDELAGMHPKSHLDMMEREFFDLCLTFYPAEGVEMYYRPWSDEFGIPVLSLPLAADTSVFNPCKGVNEYRSNLGFIGGIHRTKQDPFDTYIRPLLDRYTMVAAGKGWDGWPVKRISLAYGEEPRVLSSASVIPNIHMDLSREVPAMPPNMRTFQSIAGGGFVVSDHVPALRHYFQEEEVPMGLEPDDYMEKIDFFMNHPEERHQYWSRAYSRLLEEHTYVHRVRRLLAELSPTVLQEGW